MKKLLIFLVLVSCGIIAFLFLGNDIFNTTIQTEKQIPKVSSGTDPEPILEEESAPLQTTETPTNQKPLQPPPAPGESPVEIEVEPEPPVISESPVSESEPTEPAEQEQNNNEESNENSYPIEDAEIYFVPPEQRYPGNLGGPPPLNLPDQEFPEEQAPTAPGSPE